MHAFTNLKKCTTTQNKHKKTKARFSRLLRHPAWKWSGLFSKEKISKGGKNEEKRISGQAYDTDKQTTHTVLKSKIESRAHYAPEPTQGDIKRTS